jgi:DNA polymerase III delta prime subunit
MLDAILISAAQRFAERVAERVADKATDDVKRTEPSVAVLQAALSRAIAQQMVQADSWSVQVQFYGMSRPESTETGTVGLGLAEIPRRFRSSDTGVELPETLDEREVLRDRGHYLLLGDPGAGKTTTIKRLVRMLLNEPRDDGTERWNLPLVIQLREHKAARSVPAMILRQLGIVDVLSDSLSNDQAVAQKMDGESSLMALVCEFLDDVNPAIFLDGLDEVDPADRLELEDSLEVFARSLTNSKIIVSCRSGDYRRHLDGFSILELCPLTPVQIRDISQRWLPERADDFLHSLTRSGAGELANRPLFLCQMIVLYQRRLALPDQPSALCRQLIRLMLQDWDEQRRIVRRSAYGQFGVDAKQEFLTAMAFELTFVFEKNRFEHADLVSAYARLSRRFGLPAGESSRVAAEIEAHTGIIVKAGVESFEFSHLSLQELLAAEYLVRLPDQRDVSRWYNARPAVVAVAVALSSDSSRFLASTILGMPVSSIGPGLNSFIARLAQERPRFAESLQLGVALLHIIGLHESDDVRALVSVLSLPGVSESVVPLIREVDDTNASSTGRVALALADENGLHIKVDLPRDCRIDLRVYHHLRPMLK